MGYDGSFGFGVIFGVCVGTIVLLEFTVNIIIIINNTLTLTLIITD
jgi:hypothetical protein